MLSLSKSCLASLSVVKILEVGKPRLQFGQHPCTSRVPSALAMPAAVRVVGNWGHGLTPASPRTISPRRKRTAPSMRPYYRRRCRTPTATGDPRRVARGAGVGCTGAVDGRWRGRGPRSRVRRGVAHVGVAEGAGAELQAAPPTTIFVDERQRRLDDGRPRTCGNLQGVGDEFAGRGRLRRSVDETDELTQAGRPAAGPGATVRRELGGR